jgi:hypothetical protein
MIYTFRYKENKNPVNKLAIFSYTCFIWIEVKRYQDLIYQYIRIPNDMFLYKSTYKQWNILDTSNI